MQDEKGNKSVRRAAHVKICEPVDKVINQLPPQAVYEQYGRRSKLLIHPKDIPEVPLQLFGQQQKEPGDIDECDESQSREETDVMVHEISHNDGLGMKLTNSQPIGNDTMWNSLGQQPVEKYCGASLVTNNLAQMDSDSSDESRSRLQSSPLETTCNSGQERFKVTDEGTEMTKQGDVDQTWNPGQTVRDFDEESRSRQARCSMSADQRMQQPVTPVVQNESVGSTVVNIQDVDECLVTNKHTNVKHDSISTSNKWLSSTFSIITSGILGTNQAKMGEDSTENVDANSNAKLVFKPEFNFFL